MVSFVSQKVRERVNVTMADPSVSQKNWLTVVLEYKLPTKVISQAHPSRRTSAAHITSHHINTKQ